MVRNLVMLATCSLLFIGAASADTFDNTKVCDKMKMCALEEMDSQEIPPEMKPMIEQMFDSQCKVMFQQYDVALKEANLLNKANACVEEVFSMSCDELMEMEGEPKTPACMAFKKAADDAGVDLEKLATE